MKNLIYALIIIQIVLSIPLIYSVTADESTGKTFAVVFWNIVLFTTLVVFFVLEGQI